MQHSTELQGKRQGENLAMYSMKWPKPFAAASKCWLSEKKDWKGGVIRMSDFYAVGHYTQVSRREVEVACSLGVADFK